MDMNVISFITEFNYLLLTRIEVYKSKTPQDAKMSDNQTTAEVRFSWK